MYQCISVLNTYIRYIMNNKNICISENENVAYKNKYFIEAREKEYIKMGSRMNSNLKHVFHCFMEVKQPSGEVSTYILSCKKFKEIHLSNLIYY